MGEEDPIVGPESVVYDEVVEIVVLIINVISIRKSKT